MRKSLNLPWFFRLAAAVLCTTLLFSTTNSFTQDAASRKTPKAVQRQGEAGTVVSQPSKNAVLTEWHPELEDAVPMPGHRSWFHRHEWPIALLIVGGGIFAGAWLALHEPHCSHYEPGNNGVNMSCPKER